MVFFEKVDWFSLSKKENLRLMNYKVNKKESDSKQKLSPILLPKKSNKISVAVLSVLCAVCFAFHIYLARTGNHAVLALALGAVFCAAYACVVCGSKSTILKSLPLAAGIVSAAVCLCAFEFSASALVSVLLCAVFDITLSACLIYSAAKGLTRAFTIATVCAGVVVNVLLCIVAAFLLEYGTFSIDLMLIKLNEFFETVKQTLVLQTQALLETPEFAESLQAALETSGKTVSNEEIIQLMMDSSTLVLGAFKLVLPAVLGIYAMAISSVAVSLFSALIKACKVKIYYGRKWMFFISTTGARLYNFLFFMSLVGSFFSMPQTLYITFINFVAIFTPAFCYVAIKEIVLFFTKKGMKKFSASALTIVLICVVAGIIGPSVLLLLALIGVHTTLSKQRIRFVIYKD